MNWLWFCRFFAPPIPKAPMFDLSQLKSELSRDEGRKAIPYQDSKGIWTVGVGHNLQSGSLTDDVIDLILEHDIQHAQQGLTTIFPEWPALDDVRQRVLLNMAFNMGQQRLSGFVNFLAAVKKADWETAAREMASSAWASQVGPRAVRLEAMMRTGSFGANHV